MEVGKKFAVRQYYTSAKIGYNSESGEVLVVHNNSSPLSHFLVASRDHTDEGEPSLYAAFIESFMYATNTVYGEAEATHQYRRALNKAVQIAMSR